MISVTDEFKEAVRENRIYDIQDKIVLKDGTIIQLTLDNVLSYSISTATSGDSSFDIGSTVMGMLSVDLDNTSLIISDESKLDGATILTKIGLDVNGTFEYITRGTFIINSAKLVGDIISIEAYDSFIYAEVPFNKVPTTRYLTIADTISSICTYCGIAVDISNIEALGVIGPLPRAEISTTMTARDAIAYCAQLCGMYARINSDNVLEFKWYNSESTAYEVTEQSSFSRSKSPIVITGIKLKYSDSDTNETVESLIGQEGYVIEIEGNPFLNQYTFEQVKNIISSVIGTKIIPFSLSCVSDPTIEAGDRIKIVDRKGNITYSFITNCKFSLGGSQELSLSAETETEKQYQSIPGAQRIISKANESTKKQISNYDIQVQKLTNLMTNAFGVFKSEETLSDGSTVFYIHNKKTLASSTIIWKMTADAFAVSTDGGKNWSAGIDASGNAVINLLSVIGINFSWAKGGTLTLGGNGNGNGVLQVLDTSGNQICSIKNNGIIANKGKVGGWNINDSTFYQDAVASDGNRYRIFMQPPSSTDKWWGFSIQRYNTEIATYEPMFYVDGNGDLYSKHMNCDGNIDVKNVQCESLNGVICTKSMVDDTPVLDFGSGIHTLGSYNYMWGSLTVGQNSAVGNRTLYVNGTAQFQGTVYNSGGGTVFVSDRNKKHDIEDVNEKYLQLFDLLIPKLFKYNDGTSGRKHIGYIAQEVEQSMKDIGLDSNDLGALIIDENKEYGLRYDELFMLQHLKIKQLEERINSLESKLGGK